MNNKTQGIISIVAAIVVLLSAIWSPVVSLVMAVVALVGMGVAQLGIRGKGAGERDSSPLASLGTQNDAVLINPDQVKMHQEHLEKVMGMARAQGQVANDEVERALGVSDRTASRYLQELEGQGKLVQVGVTGRKVSYRLK